LLALASTPRMRLQVFNLWSLPGPGPQPGICPPGSYRRDICRQDICQPARGRRQPAEAAGGRQQLLSPRKPKKRYQGSRISTLKSLTMSWVGCWNSAYTHRSNPMLATTAMNRPRSWRFRQPFFGVCCENSTKIEGFGSRSISWFHRSGCVGTYFRVSTGRPGRSAPYIRDSCRQTSAASFALLWRPGQRTRSRSRPGPRNRQSN